MTTDIDPVRYRENLERLDELDLQIASIASRRRLSADDERKLNALRLAYKVTDEERKEHVRACLLALVDPDDGVTPVNVQSGHTPERELDDDY